MGDAVGAWSDRDAVRVSGADAATYLHGQLSQAITTLAVGESKWSLLLQPTGRLTAWLRVTRTADEDFVLDVAPGWAEAVVARLNRFKIRVDCEFAEFDGWRMLSVRDTEPPDAGSVGDTTIVAPVAGSSIGVVGYDLVGPAPGAPDGLTIDADAVEEDRVRDGIPEMGAELDDTVIAAEMGSWFVEESVDWTKGCYVGQELVARVDSRGSNTPLRLRSLDLTGPASPGDEVFAEGGKAAGHVTSVFGSLALARVGRAIEPPATVLVNGSPANVTR